MTGYLTRSQPNRPDALGYWQDSKAQESKYAEAIRRLVAALKADARPVDPDDVRGKRRMRDKPHENSNTLKTYLKSLELFSYWMQGSLGKELDPQYVTREVCMKFVDWMLSSDPPNVNTLRVQAGGSDLFAVYRAVEQASKTYGGWVNIVQVYEALGPQMVEKYANVDGKWRLLHHDLNLIVRDYKAILRDPSTKTVRKRTGVIWGANERDPLTYKYMPADKRPYKIASAITHVSALSAIFQEFTEGENYPGGEAPLMYNPWKGGRRSPRGLLQRKLDELQRRRAGKTIISHELVDALIAATRGRELEDYRNHLIVMLLIHTGVRAEELVGAQRQDLVEVGGVGSLRVIGKGDKERTIPLYSEVRDSYVAFATQLQVIAGKVSDDPDVAYKAIYAQTLLEHPKAPLVPSMVRWGKNERVDIDPDKAALEPLDTSGLRAIVDKLASRARVFDKRTQQVRALNREERSFMHPHALRHYAATAAQEAGLPMLEVKRILGHEDIHTTERYVHIAPQAMAQIGAYIAKARSGLVMSPEEADQLQHARKSILADTRIAAAPAEFPERKGRQARVERRAAAEQAEVEDRPAEPADETAAAPQQPRPLETVVSPNWAYSPRAEDRYTYMMRQEEMDRISGERVEMERGAAIQTTLRIGQRSRLPFYAGRAGRWTFEQMAPIISPFQTFVKGEIEESGGLSIIPKLVMLYEDIRKNKGITAATAYMVWLQEILSVASAAFLSVMRDRGDVWIEFDQPARPIPPKVTIVDAKGRKKEAGGGDFSVVPSEEEAPLYHVVRMHPGDRIVEWFQQWATTAKGTTVRAEPAWNNWEGDPQKVRIVSSEDLGEGRFRTTLHLPRLKGFSAASMFDPTGRKRERRVRYREPLPLGRSGSEAPWKHAKVVSYTPDIGEEKLLEVVFEGDEFPKRWARFQYAESGTRAVGTRYAKEPGEAGRPPALVAIDALPDWFFLDDPILALPDDERKQLRDWVEKLSGTRISGMRLVSDLRSIATEIQAWWDIEKDSQAAYDDARRRRDATAERLAMARVQEADRIKKEILRKVKAQYGIDIEIDILVGKKGIETTKRLGLRKRGQKTEAVELIDKIEKLAPDADKRLAKKIGPLPRMDPLEKRLIAYMETKGVTFDPGTFKQEPIVHEHAGLFGVGRIEWNDDNTIQHTPRFKERWFFEYGTDSECVIRRALRGLWEMKKEGRFTREGEDQPHKDMVARHWLAYLAYIVPCPAAFEGWLERNMDWFRAQNVHRPAAERTWPMPYNSFLKEKLFREWYRQAVEETLKRTPEAEREALAESDYMSLLELVPEEDQEEFARSIAEEFQSFADLQRAGITKEMVKAWGTTAVPNMRAIQDTMPNPVVMLFALLWPV